MEQYAPTERALVTMQQSIDQFLLALKRKGSPPTTIHAYRWALMDLAKFLAERRIRTTNKLTREVLEDWQEDQLGRWRPKSRQLGATAVRVWLEWADEREQVPPHLIRALTRVQVPRRLPRPIAREHLDLILSYLAPRRPNAGILYLRDRALFHYLLETGARISEALQVERVGWDRYTVKQKGGREKVLELGDRVRAMVTDYLAARTDELGWLWVTNSPIQPTRKMGIESTNDAWRRLAPIVGVPFWTSHNIRHTCGTLLYEKTGDIYLVAQHLGHANLSAVQGYVQVSATQRKKNLEVIEGVFAVSDPAPAVVKGRPDNRPNRGVRKRTPRR